jgi:selenocysteine-specific elongation factor
MPRVEVLSLTSGLAEPTILNGLIEYLLEDKQLIAKDDKLGPADRQPKLTKRQRSWQEDLLQAIRAGAAAPPTRKELAAQLGTDEESLLPLIALSLEDGELVQIADGFLYGSAALERCRTILVERFAAMESLKLNEIRDAWGVTRKHAVPLAEWFDQQGLTRRNGDLRTGGPNLNKRFPGNS